MTKGPSFKEFAQVARSYVPFPWENSEEDVFQAVDVRGKHSVLVSLIRFWKVIVALKENCSDFKTIIDVGPYPGTMIKLLRVFFQRDFTYWAIGLGLSDDYRREMEALGGRCFETELDPDFVDAKTVHEWPMRNADCVLLLDVIEHLTNPIPCLDAINRALRPGGTLVVTTDNVTSFANTYQMLKKGHSPNVHPLRSSLFYRGEWRPHFREFSAEELAFYFRYAGFRVLRHEFFERRQGDFRFDGQGRLHEHNRYGRLKGLVQRGILSVAPHLKDHQIAIVQKTEDYDTVSNSRPKPTESKAEWLSLRSRAGL